MLIKLRYFASIKDITGRSEDQVSIEERATVRDAWLKANKNQPLPNYVLAAINMEYVELNEVLRDGDEVAFFPPVTGGQK